jgi:hypothetical protein
MALLGEGAMMSFYLPLTLETVEEDVQENRWLMSNSDGPLGPGALERIDSPPETFHGESVLIALLLGDWRKPREPPWGIGHLGWGFGG